MIARPPDWIVILSALRDLIESCRTPCLCPRASFVTLLFVLSACSFVGCQEAVKTTQEDAGSRELPQLQAAVWTVNLQPWPAILRSHGSLVPDEVAIVGARIEGRVDQVHVDLGDEVRDGTPLATLAQQEYRLLAAQAEAQLLQARSAVGLAEDSAVSSLNPENAPPVREQKALWNESLASLERARQLKVRNAITPAELEQITAATEVAEARYRSALNSVREKIAVIGLRDAEVALARENLAQTEIVAPFTGLVQLRQVSPGSYVRPGDPIATVVRTDLLRFRGIIPERYALQISIGQQVTVDVESVTEPLLVQISRISPAVDLSSRSLLFEAVIENQQRKLRSGLFAEARIVTDPEATALVIPESSLVEFAGAEKVWKVEDGQSREQQVLTGERRSGQILVLQGLQPGDQILLDGASGRVARIKPPAADSAPETVGE